jgi:MFS family permease
MSTFDSTINAGASYIVKDLYEPWRRRVSARELVWVGYAASALIVGLGLAIALLARATVLGVWVNIVILLFPAFLVPFALRWYWGRFNGAGFAAGVLAGFLAACGWFWLQPAGWNEAQQFLLIAGVSLAGALIVTFATAPVPEPQLRTFYQRVGPFGGWPRAWRRQFRDEHRRDVLRAIIATAWQVLTFLIPMGAVLGMWPAVVMAAVAWLALFYFLLRDLGGGESVPLVTRMESTSAAR